MTSVVGLPLSRSTVDRDSYVREDADALDQLWQSPVARVVLVDDSQVLVDESGANLATVAPEAAPAGERYYLGRTEDEAFFAVRAPFTDPPAGGRAAGLREIGGTLGDQDAGLAVHAISLERWHAAHQHCPRCGAATVVVRGGSQRDCPDDGSNHFPRVDPAVIMLVYGDDGRCVLGRQESWPENRFSVLAGFVEPGESLEHAVVREVAEEVGLEVGDVSYVASQPWPFPSSLMLGFTARVVGGELAPDDHEIAEAHWFSREQLATGIAEGRMLPPTGISIARYLIEEWYGEPL